VRLLHGAPGILDPVTPSHHPERTYALYFEQPRSRLSRRCHHERRSARDLLLVLRVPHPLALLALGLRLRPEGSLLGS
jgi:hypothetical protein